MDAGRSVLLLSAPAGFGKSTLLADWVHDTRSVSFAWLSLDPEDNEPVRFWSYLAFAVQKVRPGFGSRALSLLGALPVPGASGSSPARPALALMLNELAASGDIVVILDDCHRVTSPEIHNDLSWAIERWPHNARLVLSTRVDPPLPLARLRAMGRLAEIRAEDLRMTRSESAELFRSLASSPLDPEQARPIIESLDGWVAGVKMAALARRDARSARLGVAGPGKAHILDYLAEEVLEQQEPPIQEFLLRTGVLDRFCASLADAVGDTPGGREALEEVWRRNLFLIQLDDERQWFRYHPLFGDLLRARLARIDARRAGELHARASRWFEDNNMPDDALHHAMAAGDTGRAVSLVLAHSRRLLWTGWAGTVTRWLSGFPEALVQDDLRLVVARAWARCFANQWSSMEDDLDTIERLVTAGRAAGGYADTDLAERIRVNAEATVAILRAYVAWRADDWAAAMGLARKAVRLNREAPPALRGAAFAVLGFSLREAGNLTEACEAFRESGPLFLA